MTGPITDQGPIVDARGHLCPVPSLRLRKAMAGRPPGSCLTLLATDRMARIDVPHMLSEIGGRVVAVVEADGFIRLTVETPAAPTD